ncbi:hypothetical protein CEUSTIGMA_g8867.t1 [Chlamydomonas eustigma]|uniref:Uncharacterized protein n=1 Tax=Chlamydomonas eustigma TaxID=1157962 RepID=A0A250XEC9_9CHLO|nr:hypothetical protein CEUSTIGMA_g8867.t1 [Chlamydomonas eustigma]|eukprot:GAX81437.1 hypothetical protein CEUSTIGMA_g8867.t1 [Chlamydomonas eustigma]
MIRVRSPHSDSSERLLSFTLHPRIVNLGRFTRNAHGSSLPCAPPSTIASTQSNLMHPCDGPSIDHADDGAVSDATPKPQKVLKPNPESMVYISRSDNSVPSAKLRALGVVSDQGRSEEQVPAIHDSEEQVPAIHDSEVQVPAIHDSEEQVPAIHDSEVQVPAIHDSEEQVPAIHDSEEQVPAIHDSEEQVPAIHDSEVQVPAIHDSMDMYISSSAAYSTSYQSLSASGLRHQETQPTSYLQTNTLKDSDDSHNPPERLHIKEGQHSLHTPSSASRASSGYVDVRDKGWREGWLLVTELDEAGKRGDLRTWKLVLDLYQSAMTARECVVAYRALLFLSQSSHNRALLRSPTYKGTCWGLSRDLLKELLRLGKRGAGQGVAGGGKTDHEPEAVLDAALAGAQYMNMIDVCQCLQGLAGAHTRNPLLTWVLASRALQLSFEATSDASHDPSSSSSHHTPLTRNPEPAINNPADSSKSRSSSSSSFTTSATTLIYRVLYPLAKLGQPLDAAWLRKLEQKIISDMDSVDLPNFRFLLESYVVMKVLPGVPLMEAAYQRMAQLIAARASCLTSSSSLSSPDQEGHGQVISSGYRSGEASWGEAATGRTTRDGHQVMQSEGSFTACVASLIWLISELGEVHRESVKALQKRKEAAQQMRTSAASASASSSATGTLDASGGISLLVPEQADGDWSPPDMHWLDTALDALSPRLHLLDDLPARVRPPLLILGHRGGPLYLRKQAKAIKPCRKLQAKQQQQVGDSFVTSSKTDGTSSWESVDSVNSRVCESSGLDDFVDVGKKVASSSPHLESGDQGYDDVVSASVSSFLCRYYAAMQGYLDTMSPQVACNAMSTMRSSSAPPTTTTILGSGCNCPELTTDAGRGGHQHDLLDDDVPARNAMRRLHGVTRKSMQPMQLRLAMLRDLCRGLEVLPVMYSIQLPSSCRISEELLGNWLNACLNLLSSLSAPSAANGHPSSSDLRYPGQGQMNVQDDASSGRLLLGGKDCVHTTGRGIDISWSYYGTTKETSTCYTTATAAASQSSSSKQEHLVGVIESSSHVRQHARQQQLRQCSSSSSSSAHALPHKGMNSMNTSSQSVPTCVLDVLVSTGRTFGPVLATSTAYNGHHRSKQFGTKRFRSEYPTSSRQYLAEDTPAPSTAVLYPWLDEFCEATIPALRKVDELEKLVDLAKALNSLKHAPSLAWCEAFCSALDYLATDDSSSSSSTLSRDSRRTKEAEAMRSSHWDHDKDVVDVDASSKGYNSHLQAHATVRSSSRSKRDGADRIAVTRRYSSHWVALTRHSAEQLMLFLDSMSSLEDERVGHYGSNYSMSIKTAKALVQAKLGDLRSSPSSQISTIVDKLIQLAKQFWLKLDPGARMETVPNRPCRSFRTSASERRHLPYNEMDASYEQGIQAEAEWVLSGLSTDMISLLTSSETISLMGSISAIFYGLSSTLILTDDHLDGHKGLQQNRGHIYDDMTADVRSSSSYSSRALEVDSPLRILKLDLMQHSASLMHTFTYPQLVNCLVYASRFGVGLPSSWLQGVQERLQTLVVDMKSVSADNSNHDVKPHHSAAAGSATENTMSPSKRDASISSPLTVSESLAAGNKGSCADEHDGADGADQVSVSELTRFLQACRRVGWRPDMSLIDRLLQRVEGRLHILNKQSLVGLINALGHARYQPAISWMDTFFGASIAILSPAGAAFYNVKTRTSSGFNSPLSLQELSRLGNAVNVLEVSPSPQWSLAYLKAAALAVQTLLDNKSEVCYGIPSKQLHDGASPVLKPHEVADLFSSAGAAAKPAWHIKALVKGSRKFVISSGTILSSSTTSTTATTSVFPSHPGSQAYGEGSSNSSLTTSPDAPRNPKPSESASRSLSSPTSQSAILPSARQALLVHSGSASIALLAQIEDLQGDDHEDEILGSMSAAVNVVLDEGMVWNKGLGWNEGSVAEEVVEAANAFASAATSALLTPAAVRKMHAMDVCRVLEAYWRLGVPASSPLFQEIQSRGREFLKSCDAHHATLILQAMAYAGHQPSGYWLDCYLDWSAPLLSRSFTPLCLVKTMRSFAVLNIKPDREWVSLWMEAMMTTSLPECNLRLCSQAAWAVASLGFQPPLQWMRALLDRTRSLAHDETPGIIKPQQAVHLLWAMCRTAFTPPRDYVELLLNEAKPASFLSGMPPRLLALLACTLCGLSYRPQDTWMVALMEAIRLNRSQLDAQGLALAVRSVVTLVMQPPAFWLADMLAACAFSASIFKETEASMLIQALSECLDVLPGITTNSKPGVTHLDVLLEGVRGRHPDCLELLTRCQQVRDMASLTTATRQVSTTATSSSRHKATRTTSAMIITPGRQGNSCGGHHDTVASSAAITSYPPSACHHDTVASSAAITSYPPSAGRPQQSNRSSSTPLLYATDSNTVDCVHMASPAAYCKLAAAAGDDDRRDICTHNNKSRHNDRVPYYSYSASSGDDENEEDDDLDAFWRHHIVRPSAVSGNHQQKQSISNIMCPGVQVSMDSQPNRMSALQQPHAFCQMARPLRPDETDAVGGGGQAGQQMNVNTQKTMTKDTISAEAHAVPEVVSAVAAAAAVAGAKTSACRERSLLVLLEKSGHNSGLLETDALDWKDRKLTQQNKLSRSHVSTTAQHDDEQVVCAQEQAVLSCAASRETKQEKPQHIVYKHYLRRHHYCSAPDAAPTDPLSRFSELEQQQLIGDLSKQERRKIWLQNREKKMLKKKIK